MDSKRIKIDRTRSDIKPTDAKSFTLNSNYTVSTCCSEVDTSDPELANSIIRALKFLDEHQIAPRLGTDIKLKFALAGNLTIGYHHPENGDLVKAPLDYLVKGQRQIVEPQGWAILA